MHGLPLAKEIVEHVISSVGETPGKVITIEVEMGPDATIDTEELELCFNVASEGTKIEKSDISITLKPGLVECLDCGKKEEKTRLDRIPVCSGCFSTNLKVEDSGIIIKHIEFEEETA